MTDKSNWNYVDTFTWHQGCVFVVQLRSCKNSRMSNWNHPSEAVAAKQMLIGAIQIGALPVTGANRFSAISDYAHCHVSREDLILLATAKELRPIFLFDTILRLEEKSASQGPPEQTSQLASSDKNAKDKVPRRRGRPHEHDWDSFALEIIRRANSPDGLPETQAELIRDMLQRFFNEFGSEPAESSVKTRISKIYRYLDQAEKS